ncbi:hypothetical protein DFQ27_007258 [Actinomortierella ambigua]|uniref:Uncharacterized protein n=1 Tax=Actinomortierella ambigua TaxID=1343610 RepID=A0A9P6PW26_9FUNG|nr:hypothetical protein DFQ27_007258 [Actinomortierella ambigua]
MLTPPEQFGIVEPGLYRSDTLHPSHFPFIRSLNLKTAILLTPELPSRAMSNFFEENHIRLIDLGLGTWKHGGASAAAAGGGGGGGVVTAGAGSGSGSGGLSGNGAGSGMTGSTTGTTATTTTTTTTTATTAAATTTAAAAPTTIGHDDRDPSMANESRRPAAGIPPTAPAFQTSLWKPLSEELIKDGLELILDAKNYPIIVMDTSGIHEIGTFMGCLRRLQHWNFSSIIVEYRAYAGNKARYVNEQFIELFDVDWITLPEDLPQWWIEQEDMWHEEEEEKDRELEREQQSGQERPSVIQDYPRLL